MQKIKLFTFHNAENYGAMLQAYALKEALKKLGTAPQFINYENEKILSDYKLIRTKSFKSFLSSLWYLSRNLKRKRNFKRFSDKYLDTNTKGYSSVQEIEQDIEQNDVFVAGSDQIWNPELTGGLSDVYTLNFKTNFNVRKTIYGASLGNEGLLKKYSSDFKEKLETLDYISVREQSIIEPLKNISKKDIEKVVDPTLLLTKEEWNNLIESNETINLPHEKYILVYTLFESDEVTKIANYISHITDLKIVHFRKYNTYENELLSLYTYGPADFVNAFKNAAYVITNSFHGTVFSLIFERNFYSVLPSQRAGRITDLLNNMGINTRIIQDESQVNINNNIDYTEVKEKINCLRVKSIDFLKKGVTKETHV